MFSIEAIRVSPGRNKGINLKNVLDLFPLIELIYCVLCEKVVPGITLAFLIMFFFFYH